jgi:hypothetical protein
MRTAAMWLVTVAVSLSVLADWSPILSVGCGLVAAGARSSLSKLREHIRPNREPSACDMPATEPLPIHSTHGAQKLLARLGMTVIGALLIVMLSLPQIGFVLVVTNSNPAATSNEVLTVLATILITRTVLQLTRLIKIRPPRSTVRTTTPSRSRDFCRASPTETAVVA